MTNTDSEYDEYEIIIQSIIDKTNYSREEAGQKFAEANGDYKKVLRDFLICPPKKSINQQIYTQMRLKLDESMRDYNERKENKK
jgi:hypothetical protein